MTKQEIKALVGQKIAGQGSQVDIGGALADILNAIVDLIPGIPDLGTIEDGDEVTDFDAIIRNNPILKINGSLWVLSTFNNSQRPFQQVEERMIYTNSISFDSSSSSEDICGEFAIDFDVDHDGRITANFVAV